MEAAIGAARGLVGRVVNLLSNDLVQAYVASAELGLNSEKTKDDLMRTQVVLREAQRRGVINNPSLEELLHKLHTKVGKAEDALDELQYFIIQDQLDGTQYAVPDLGNTLWGHARHIRHAIHHAIGNFILPCFSCWLLQDDDHGAAAINHPHNTSNPASGNDGSVTKLSFDRVAMSKKIKQAIEEMHSLCDQFLELLKIIPDHSNSTTTVNLKRPLTGSITAQDKLYGREDLFEQTIKDLITNCTDSNKALSVMPIIGPGGIGKTTFTQHLYKDKRTREHYPARAWICVSTDFDVLKLSQQILSQIEENNDAYQTSSLNQLQNSIEKGLKSKRFLIVFDDIWECTTQDWETLLAPMGKGETTGNMVLVTTRFPSKVDDVKTTDPILLKGLELDDFLTFFEALIFEGQIPHNLKELAKDIAKKLKGSPLAAKTLKISPSEFGSEVTFPSTLSRFYHLQLLDLSDWYDQSVKLPNDINRLTNLCHFIAEREVHSNVPEVGKMKYLKELKEFHVKKESVGFELSELGDLTELGGELSIYNIGNVATKEEAMKAKLVSKGDLETLRLVWGGLDASEPSDELSDVLDGLEPHPNLQSLGIENHGGSVGPHWLCGHMSIKMLVSLHLEGVSLAILPPFGQLLHLRSLKLINISSLVQIKPGVVGVTAKSFTQLKEIVLDSLSEFTQWDEAPNAHSFSMLEKIVCKECPNLYALPFLQDCSMGSYNHLWKLEITGCPKLPMPLMPHTSTLTDVTVDTRRTGRMVYANHNLYLTRYNRALAWHNMAGKVESITFKAGSTVPWIILQSLTSFKKLVIEGDSSKQSLASLSYLTSLTNLRIQDCKNFKVGGFNLLMASNLKDLAVHNITEYYPRSVAADLLSELAVEITRSKKLLPPTAGSLLQLVRLNVDSISAVLVALVCRLLAATLKELVITCDREVENLTKDEEKALQLLTSLQELSFWRCHRLRSFPQGLHGLPSLRKLQAITCRRIRSLPKKGIPTSLRELSINDCSRKLHNQAKKLNQRNLSVSA
ncbi:putative disease resistance protein RGA3 [Triticum dicoccoides]|uniref:putative disease resistance protein RGA3 n=1 Tax=Triticum dicoccoides TaxID=85692 RepID=UPI001891CA3B|nr:putative disease resistance protein RGA3 [Triticum dicoccoides]